MKIAYVTTYDPSNILYWSGVGANMAKSLHGQGFDLSYISHLHEDRKLLLNFKKAYYKYLRHEVFYRERQPSVVRNFAKQIDRKLAGIEHDILFSPGSIPIADLENDAPIVFWTDSSFHGMVDYYPEFSNLCKETLTNGHMLEQKALEKCALAIYASDWAADIAIKYYNVDPNKVKVVPFGSNLDDTRTVDHVEDIISSKTLNTCELLFIGVDWERKGGDTVMQVAEMLQTNNIPVRLTILGCQPPKRIEDNPLTEVHGFVDKATTKGKTLIEECLRRSHFLMVPSLAECFGIVYCEANSFGVPSIGRQTGGVSGAIKNGVNGMAFHPDAQIEAYCAYIEGYFKDPSKYRDLALSSFNEYKTRLNWNSAGKIVKGHIQELIY